MRKAEEFVSVMCILYTYTLYVSSYMHATCGQIWPILEKLKDHFRITKGDLQFVIAIKEKVLCDYPNATRTLIIHTQLAVAFSKSVNE